MTQQEIEEIADDAGKLRYALARRGFGANDAVSMVVAAMPAIVAAGTDDSVTFRNNWHREQEKR